MRLFNNPVIPRNRENGKNKISQNTRPKKVINITTRALSLIAKTLVLISEEKPDQYDGYVV